MSRAQLSKPPMHRPRGYAIAALALGAATLVRAALDPALGDHLPYVTYFVAVASVAWLGGLGPAVVMMVVGSYVSELLFAQPHYRPFPYNFSAQGLVSTFTYFMVTGMSILLTESMHRARRRSDQDRLALSASETRLRLFIENAPAGIAMFDRDMRYLAVSRRFMNDYGLTGEVLDKSHYDLFPEIPPRWIDIYRRALAGEVLAADEAMHRCQPCLQWLPLQHLVGRAWWSDGSTCRRAQSPLRLQPSHRRPRARCSSSAGAVASACAPAHARREHPIIDR